ncbi:MAG TPA: SGNH/GDSL hydrolase family protein [Thermoanaerobaculia bacterium]|nr:SGNH/GDSL hydrolase family protein [Thermoanaerobaculia bacterium]
MARTSSTSKALEIGKAMAAGALQRRRKAARTRQRALAKIPGPVVHRITAGPKGMVVKTAVTHQSAGVLIAEGDSWFDYPFHDVLSDLEDIYGFDVESVAHKGDTVEDMAYSGGQLDDFSRRVEKVLRTGVRPRAILLSGGGNDVAGDEFAVLLNHASSGIAGLNESVLTGVIDERVRDAYVTILSAITTVCEGQIGQSVPIIIHGYDYPVPDGRGFLGGWGPLPGPWLEPGFRRKGYQAMTIRQQICVRLIDRFNEMLARLAGKTPFTHVRYLDLRNTLSQGANYEDWWANELHPTPKGFEAVTRKFASIV